MFGVILDLCAEKIRWLCMLSCTVCSEDGRVAMISLFDVSSAIGTEDEERGMAR